VLTGPAADGRSVRRSIPGQFQQVRTYLKKRILVQNAAAANINPEEDARISRI
jgi:hypothetical protein